MAGEDEQVEVTATEARAGTKPGVMRYVLAISMMLVIVIFLFIVWRPLG